MKRMRTPRERKMPKGAVASRRFRLLLRPCLISHQPFFTDGVDLVLVHQLAQRLPQLVRQFVALHTDGCQHVVANLIRDVRPAQAVLVIPKHADNRPFERVLLCFGNPRVLRFVSSGAALVASVLGPPTISFANSTADISSTADQCRGRSFVV